MVKTNNLHSDLKCELSIFVATSSTLDTREYRNAGPTACNKLASVPYLNFAVVRDLWIRQFELFFDKILKFKRFLVIYEHLSNFRLRGLSNISSPETQAYHFSACENPLY